MVACGGTTSSAGLTSPAISPKRGGTLKVGISGGGSSDTLNPLAWLSSADYSRISQLFEPLVGWDENAIPTLVLAEEITPNSTATEWTIRVRSDVTFHNGKDLTADDVLYTFQTILNPKSPTSGASSLSSLDLKSASKLDARTIRIPCTTPFSTFLDVLPVYYFDIIPVGFDLKNPVGTGPFRYESFTPGVQSTFVRNEHYWQAGLPYVDSVVISDFSDQTSQINALGSGQVHLINDLTAAAIASLQSAGSKALISLGGGMNPITMRVDQAPFTDVRVRQAMRLIADRPAMLETVFLGHGIVGNDIFGIWDPVYDHSLPQRHQDLQQAKFLLKQAGHENLSVSMVTSPVGQGMVETATVFQQQAAQAGVKINLQQVQPTEFYGPNYTKWVFSQDTWFYSQYLPQVAQSMLPTAPFNETRWNDPIYNSLYSQALATFDFSKRTALAQEMQLIDYDRGGYIIPYFPPVIDGYAASVEGLRPAKNGLPLNNYNFKALWLR
jgi:peptide/nickel transport system substrate-binding protein